MRLTLCLVQECQCTSLALGAELILQVSQETFYTLRIIYLGERGKRMHSLDPIDCSKAVPQMTVRWLDAGWLAGYWLAGWILAALGIRVCVDTENFVTRLVVATAAVARIEL